MSARHLRIALIAAGLLLTTNGPLFFFTGRILDRPGTPPPWEDAVVRPILLGFAAATAVLVLLDHRAGTLRRALNPRRLTVFAVAAFPIWAVTSSLWSEQPSLTFWRSLIYLSLALLATALAVLDDHDRFAVLVVLAALAVGASILIALGWSHVGVSQDDFWQGIYTNPNSLGPVAALGVLAGIGGFSISTDRATRVGAMLLLGASALALYQTTSRTAWFALAVAIGVATTVTLTRTLTDRVGARRAAIVAGPIATFAALSTGLVLRSRWNDPTFAQRRTIWDGAWDYIDDRWLAGYGFFSFFEVPGRSAEQPYFDRGSAHSSVVEVLLGVGLIGLALFAIVAVAAFANALRNAWHHPTGLSWMWLAVVTFLLFENLTESFILWFSYNWVILCAAALKRTGDPSSLTHGEAPASRLLNRRNTTPSALQR